MYKYFVAAALMVGCSGENAPRDPRVIEDELRQALPSGFASFDLETSKWSKTLRMNYPFPQQLKTPSNTSFKITIIASSNETWAHAICPFSGNENPVNLTYDKDGHVISRSAPPGGGPKSGEQIQYMEDRLREVYVIFTKVVNK